MIRNKNPHRARGLHIALKAVGAGLIIPVLAFVSGCKATFIPSNGPSSSKIKSNSGKSYDLIPITGQVVTTLKHRTGSKRPDSLSTLESATKDARTRDARVFFRYSIPGMIPSSSIGVNRLPAPSHSAQTISVGDVVNVTIYETGGALFGTLNPATGATTSSAQIPPQPVDEQGEITVPYAGRVPVKGRATSAVEADIAAKLKGKAIDPQVIVTISSRMGGYVVTVTGDVKSPKLFQLGLADTRLLDVLTDAGGSTGRAHETDVTVLRGDVARTDSLAEIIANSAKNVRVQAGDVVAVKNRPRSCIAFGAAGSNKRVVFDNDQLSLAEALAQVGGPLDARADPSSIYVHRLESASLVRKLGHTPTAITGEAARVIYQLDLHSPEGFFLAQTFEVQDKDIIYLSNAGSVGLGKFLNLLNTVTSGARAEISSASTSGL